MSAATTHQDNRELTPAICAAMVEFSRIPTSTIPLARPAPATTGRSTRRNRARPLRLADQYGARHITQPAGRDRLGRVRLGLRKLRAGIEKEVA